LYYPIKSEINVIKIIKSLYKQLNNPPENLDKTKKFEFSYSLPVMTDRRTLKFFEFISEDDLVENNFKVKEPNQLNSKQIIPDIIITPLLAFDQNKYRIGYGKGFYDNTFIELSKNNIKFISIGIAYEEQFFPYDIPREEHDFHLDYIITQENIYL